MFTNYKKLCQINSGFLLVFKITSNISYNDINDIILRIKEYFPNYNANYNLYENFPKFNAIETPSAYLIPNFPDYLSYLEIFEEVYKFESLPLILSGLYFYNLLEFNFECTIQFKNRYGNCPTKIDLLRNYIPKEFTKIMKDAGHEINYGILLNTLNSFNTDNPISCSDFLFNLKT